MHTTAPAGSGDRANQLDVGAALPGPRAGRPDEAPRIAAVAAAGSGRTVGVGFRLQPGDRHLASIFCALLPKLAAMDGAWPCCTCTPRARADSTQ
jgi:hypothetical protein